jgi:Zn-dependent protease with chaperone function
MPFLLLLLLTPACLQDTWPQPGFWVDTPFRAAVLTWVGVAGAVGAAGLLSWWVRRRVAEAPDLRDELLHRYSSWRFSYTIGLLFLYGISLYVLGWGWAVQALVAPQGALPPGAELLVLAPFLVCLLFAWLFFYDAERALHGVRRSDTVWSRWEYLGYQVRQNLALVLIPVTLLILEKGLLYLFPASGDDLRVFAFAGGLAAALVVFVAMPWILRLVLGLRPLPEGPLRARLLGAARRLRFRCSNILLWNTKGAVANALVAGICPVPRYVVLTDRLVTDLTPDEVEAVFGHEVGHVKHRHMLYYLGFLLASMTVVYALATVYLQPYLDAWPTLHTREDLAILLVMALLGTYIFVVFGFLSRRCERQADLFGCRAVSCGHPYCEGHDAQTYLEPGGRYLCPTGIRTFINALEKVAALNGISRDRPGWLQSWQHSTIARRVDFLQRVLLDPRLERRFQFRVGLVKWALLVSLATVMALIGSFHGWHLLQF